MLSIPIIKVRITPVCEKYSPCILSLAACFFIERHALLRLESFGLR